MTQARTGFCAEMFGFEEVPPVFTTGMGTFQAWLVEGRDALRYRLTYNDLSSPAVAAHIHFGQLGVEGGILAFLCGGGDTPPCSEMTNVIVGVISPEDVVGIPDQGVAPGDFRALLRILRAGLAYVNVHTTQFLDGEIRGQVH